MSDDLHARFERWLVAGASGEPPRDLALHASVCASCAARVAAFDLLTIIATSRAPLPASRLVARPRPLLLRAIRATGAVAGVALAAVVVGMGIGSALQLRGDAVGAAASEAPVQGVLGATGGPSATDRPTATPNGGSPSETVATQSAAVIPEPPATPRPTTRPATARPSPTPVATVGTTPSQSAAATATQIPTPTLTPTPIPTPTPTPTETPTPTPTPTPTETPTPTPVP